MAYPTNKGYLYSFICFFLHLQNVAPTVYYPTVFWTANNCRFKINNSGKRSYSFKIKPNSHIYFLCPNIAIWRDASMKSPHLGRMYENLLLVDKESYETCSIKNKSAPYHNKELLRCDERPENMEIKYTHEIFSSSQARSDKVKYMVGRNYYFISTSDGTFDSLNNTEGGHCKTHHMKLHVYLCNNTEKCEFEMPDCSFSDPVQSDGLDYDNTRPNIPHTTETTDRVAVVGKSRSIKWLKESTHMLIHIGAALLVVILIIILIVTCFKRRKVRTKNFNEEDGKLVLGDAKDVDQPSVL